MLRDDRSVGFQLAHPAKLSSGQLCKRSRVWRVRLALVRPVLIAIELPRRVRLRKLVGFGLGTGPETRVALDGPPDGIFNKLFAIGTCLPPRSVPARRHVVYSFPDEKLVHLRS